MVVNCYRLDYDIKKFQDDLREHRGRADAVYAFMDYDQSIKLPLDVSLKACRRPADEACMGSDLFKPLDVWLGEPHYNPFAFDVGMLGNMFRVYLSVSTHFSYAASRPMHSFAGCGSDGPGLAGAV